MSNQNIRWRKLMGGTYFCPKGWNATVELCIQHPITGMLLVTKEWWVREEAYHG